MLNKYDHRNILRYSLFQIPALLIVIMVVLLIDKFYIVDNVIIIGIILLWMLKDIMLFPFVWKSYSLKDSDKLNLLIKEHGTAISSLRPKGFIKINGEIWQAELLDESVGINEGDTVEIVEVNGLVLKVKKPV